MDDTVAAYSFGTLAWLSIQALPLIVWPKFITSILNSEYQQISDVQVYFARSLGLSQLSLGLIVVVLSGALPLTTSIETPSDSISPYASAVVLLSTFYHAATASYGYLKYHHTGQTGFFLGCLGSSLLAAFGLWCLMFGGSSRISKRTGADKRTSGFPFKNVEADRRKKKGI